MPKEAAVASPSSNQLIVAQDSSGAFVTVSRNAVPIIYSFTSNVGGAVVTALNFLRSGVKAVQLFIPAWSSPEAVGTFAMEVEELLTMLKVPGESFVVGSKGDPKLGWYVAIAPKKKPRRRS
jgi:hypothetical protein